MVKTLGTSNELIARDGVFIQILLYYSKLNNKLPQAIYKIFKEAVEIEENFVRLVYVD